MKLAWKVARLAGLTALVACGDGDAKTPAACEGAGCEGDRRDADLEDELDAKASGLHDGGTQGDGAEAGDGKQAVTIRFKGKLGERDLVCGETYAGQGTTKVDATPQDFRFYVQEVRLIRKDTAEEVRVEFDTLAPFQRHEVALIDFTDAAGQCGGAGGSIVNTVIRGKVSPGTYDGIVFVNGVPEELNHAGPAETATAPLDDVTLFWNWLGGYRFIVAELTPVSGGHGAGDAGSAHGAADAGSHDAGMGHSQPDGGAHGADASAHPPSEAAFVHVGSTGCSGSPAMGFSCARKARNEVRLTGFDPARSVVVADLAKVFEASDLSNPPQCHGVAPVCTPPYAALGVNMETGDPSSTQNVFRVE